MLFNLIQWIFKKSHYQLQRGNYLVQPKISQKWLPKMVTIVLWRISQIGIVQKLAMPLYVYSNRIRERLPDFVMGLNTLTRVQYYLVLVAHYSSRRKAHGITLYNLVEAIGRSYRPAIFSPVKLIFIAYNYNTFNSAFGKIDELASEIPDRRGNRNNFI